MTDGHLRIGVAAGDHAVAIWPLLCGMAKAKYYLLTSDFIDGREAERIGLVSKAVPAEEVLPTALGIAERFAVGPAGRARLTKRSLNYWLRPALPYFEASLAYEVLNFLGPEAAEGITALREAARAELLRNDATATLTADLAARPSSSADAADGITLPLLRATVVQPDVEGQPHRGHRGRPPGRGGDQRHDRRAERPDDGLFGEEHGVVGNADSPWRWVIDPIDGTSNFVRGIPVWATLIALTHAEHGPVVGVVSAPALAARWWAGAWPRRVCRRRARVACRRRSATRRGPGVRDVLQRLGRGSG